MQSKPDTIYRDSLGPASKQAFAIGWWVVGEVQPIAHLLLAGNFINSEIHERVVASCNTV